MTIRGKQIRILLVLFFAMILILAGRPERSTAEIRIESKPSFESCKIGDTLKVTYSLTGYVGKPEVYFMVIAYGDENSYEMRRTVSDQKSENPSGSFSYTVKKDDGVRLNWIFNVYDDSDAFGYEQGEIKILNGKKIQPVKITVSLDQKEAVDGNMVTGKYSVTGGSGKYSRIILSRFYYDADRNITSHTGSGWQNLGTSPSGTFKIRARGDRFGVEIDVQDQSGWVSSTVESAMIPVIHPGAEEQKTNQEEEPENPKEEKEIRLGKKGWVTKNGKKYYGDSEGNAVTGIHWIDGKNYYFNEKGVLQKNTWAKYNGAWKYVDKSGVIHTEDLSGLSSVTVPDYVDSLSLMYFAHVSQHFVLKCSPGSYAEKFAAENGLAYDNGKKKVVGFDIQNLNEKVDWVVSNYVKPGMTDEEKARVLHNWLIANAHYDVTLAEHSANGVLVRGTGVCESYAKAYKLLLDKAGVPNRYVSGSANNGEGNGFEGHAWNLVKINGWWYHVDTTWDDPNRYKLTDPHISGFENDIYFMAYDDEMEANHQWSTSMTAGVNKPGFVESDGKTYYYTKDAEKVTGWKTIDGKKYWFAPDGAMKTGWAVIENAVYWFGEDGVRKTGKAEIDGKKYTFDKKGRLTDGKAPISGHVKSLKLDAEKKVVEMKTTKKFSLNVTADPSDAVLAWKSSNEKVATVNSKGEVKIRGKGSCTITVYCLTKDKATAKCKIKVR